MMRLKCSDFAGPIVVTVSAGTDCAAAWPARASGSSATEIRKYLLIVQNGENAASVYLNWIHPGLHLLYTGVALKCCGSVKASMAVFCGEPFRALVFRLFFAAVVETRLSMAARLRSCARRRWIGRGARRNVRLWRGRNRVRS